VEEGVPYRETLQGLLKRAKTPERRAQLEEELDQPPFPDALAYLWNVFTRLSNRRPVGMVAGLIPWSEIDAFQRVSGFRLGPWEVQLIEALDGLYMSEKASSSR
jgi:hypothetical protein